MNFNWMSLNKDLVLKIADEYHLAITIKPDGSITGTREGLAKLRRVYEIRSAAK